ncbi:MAG: response regulator transcription factor [Desulfobacterales bacterium]|nr:response regulator transcription factor [Desulfobacterales bacterium]
MKENWKADKAASILLHVIGSNQLQNELLANFLENKTGITCLNYPAHNFFDTISQANGEKHIALFDCKQIDKEKLFSGLGLRRAQKFTNCRIILCGVNPDYEIEKEALSIGIRGICYDQIPVDTYPKIIKAIADDELWYPRKMLSRFVILAQKSGKNDHTSVEMLTPREIDILKKLTAGCSNKEIANDFFISPNTVKTHIYKIFKKIDAPNRLQASLWAAKHL